jgi:hypothetical protein
LLFGKLFNLSDSFLSQIGIICMEEISLMYNKYHMMLYTESVGSSERQQEELFCGKQGEHSMWEPCTFFCP